MERKLVTLLSGKYREWIVKQAMNASRAKVSPALSPATRDPSLPCLVVLPFAGRVARVVAKWVVRSQPLTRKYRFRSDMASPASRGLLPTIHMGAARYRQSMMKYIRDCGLTKGKLKNCRLHDGHCSTVHSALDSARATYT